MLQNLGPEIRPRTDAVHRTRTVGAQSGRRRAQCHAVIEHEQRLHAPPHARSPLLARTMVATQFAEIGAEQLQPIEPSTSRRPPL
jgi:hypothetical protein